MRATIDVSELEPVVMDHRSPIWWGNVLLLCIETTMFALLIGTYFYYRLVTFQHWPPPRVDETPALFNPVPRLGVSTLNLVVILASSIPMYWADVACLRRNTLAVRIALIITVLFGATAVLLRFYEFHALYFRWDDNAYAAIVWSILGVHLLHLTTGTLENGLMTVWALIYGLDDKHARDVRVTAVYWYWIAAIWVILYVIVYWSPRW